MEKILSKLAIAALLLVMAASCREPEAKETTIIKEVEVEKPVTTQEKEKAGILERAANKVDNEVNKEADKIIDEIGDDN